MPTMWGQAGPIEVFERVLRYLKIALQKSLVMYPMPVWQSHQILCLFPSTGSMWAFGFWRFEWICDAWIWRVTSKTVGRCDQGYPIEDLRWWPDYKIERIKMLEREVREEREVRKWWYQQQSQESNLGSQQLNWWMRYTWLKGEEGPTTPLFDLVTIRIPNFTAWPSMHGHLWGHAPSPILSHFILKIIASESHFVDNFSNSGFPINSSL